MTDTLPIVERLRNAADIIEALVEALGWYRVQAEGCRKLGQHGEIYRNALDRDGGSIARAALARAKGEQQ